MTSQLTGAENEVTDLSHGLEVECREYMDALELWVYFPCMLQNWRVPDYTYPH